MLQCEWCGTVFEDDLERCPACNSKYAVGYEMENPVSRLPMEDILRVTGHLVWILGLIGGLTFFWNTDQPSERINYLLFLAGIIFICMSIVLSILFFGMGEILKRIIRIQRRVRAFSEGYHVATVRPSKRAAHQAPQNKTADEQPLSKEPVHDRGHEATTLATAPDKKK